MYINNESGGWGDDSGALMSGSDGRVGLGSWSLWVFLHTDDRRLFLRLNCKQGTSEQSDLERT